MSTPQSPGASAQDGVGHHSPLPDTEPSAQAVRAILAFGTGTTDIRLVSLADSAGAGRELNVYEDDHGYVFRCNPADGRVVQVDRHEDRYSKARPVGPNTRRPVGELRRIAHTLAAAQCSAYAADPGAFCPFEGNRDRELYVFRWETCVAPLPESVDPPAIEVGVYADGSLARFTNEIGA